MNVLDLLDRPIAYHRVFVTLTGSVKAAILLSQAMYWQKRAKQADGWWYKTAEEWQEETGLSKHEQDTARRDCEKYLKTDLRGVPATLFWRVDEQQLSQDLISENSKTSFTESAKLDLRNTRNINRNTETTTETTQGADAPIVQEKKKDLVDGYLDLLNAPGIKKMARINAILSVIGEKLHVNSETKRWQKFADFAEERQRVRGESVETFLDWLLSQNGFDVSYWSPLRCEENWPRAFVKSEPEDRPEFKRFVPETIHAVPNPMRTR